MGFLANGRNVPVEVSESAEAPYNAPDASTRFLEKGDFLRMQNLQLGYTFRPDSKFIKAVRLNAVGQNLFVLSSYSGLDPEVQVNKPMNGIPSMGIDCIAHPRAKTITLGIQATF